MMASRSAGATWIRSSKVVGLDMSIIMTEFSAGMALSIACRPRGVQCNIRKMSNTDIHARAQEMLAAYTTGATIPVPPSARQEEFDLNSAYAVEAEFSRLRRHNGHQTVGLKVGYANKAMWRVL